MKRDQAGAFHGLEIPLRALGGARAARVVHGFGQEIGRHRHDWACITIPVIGAGTEEWDGGEGAVGGGMVLVHPPRACHADRIGADGLETVSIQFDPRWLALHGYHFRVERSALWVGGPVVGTARALASAWLHPASSDAGLADATARLLHCAASSRRASPPPWLSHVTDALHRPHPVATATLAAQLDLNPAWLARAYRAAAGEGVQETARRRRVEQAVRLLRRTDLRLADIAAATGFCDQSHMSRDLRLLIGRTPLSVRSEREMLGRA